METPMKEEPQTIYDSSEEMPESDNRSIQCCSPVYTELSGFGNPFHNRLKTSFPDFNSPSVFKVQSTPLTTVKTFKWSVEEMALLKPVDIEDCPNQEVVDNSYFVTPRRAEASTKFFSGIHSIPSLVSPCTSSLPSSRTTSNQTLYQDATPSAYSFSRPPEMLEGHYCPTPDACLVLDEGSPQPTARPDNNNLGDFSSTRPADRFLPPAPIGIPGQSVSSTESVSVGVQTMLTLPLDFDLERVLGRHAYYQGEDLANNSSLRRILFQPSDSKQDLSLTSNCVASPTAQPHRSTSCRTSCYRSDPHETPKTSKNVSRSYSKSSLKSRSAKRHPVSSFDVTASTPGSFIMSLMSGRQDCSNLLTPINPVPFLSPIHSRAELDLSQISTQSTPPRNPSLCDQYSFTTKDPAPMSPITSSKPSFQQVDSSPNPYKATSTPFFQQEPKTPPSRHLPFLTPAILTGEESPSRDMVTSDYPTQCHDEDVMQEDPAPPTFSETSQLPDRVQVTHSLEFDSGIGTSYGEQSSLMQSQYRNKVKPSEHQLSFSFCPDKPPNNCSIAKLRSKRGCVKVDSSPLSIVHHALPASVNEPKRYQPDCTNPDAFVDSGTSSSSPSRDTESDPCEPLLANPTLVQQQAKHIETIGKLKNYSKWNTHKKNIESRTSH